MCKLYFALYIAKAVMLLTASHAFALSILLEWEFAR